MRETSRKDRLPGGLRAAGALALALTVACGGVGDAADPDVTEAGRRGARGDDPAPPPTAYLDGAVQAATWIRSTAIETDDGLVWPADPDDTATVVTNLYTGTPGVVLFFLELARHTGDDAYLEDARRGADEIFARVEQTWNTWRDEGVEGLRAAREADDSPLDPTTLNAGLYTGLAGLGFVLNEAFKDIGFERYRAGYTAVNDLLEALAREQAAGVDWADTTDIISGSAGTGLYLLYMAEQAAVPQLTDLAARAGQRLLEQAETAEGGLTWRMSAEYPRLMPNFSHGTAGVAYFLTELHERTGEQAFLDAALEGANRLIEIAEVEGEVCLVYHHSPGGEELQYLSWCHGPAGTARTFQALAGATGDDAWLEWVERSARGVYDSGIPEQRTDGFWNNVGQCCGSAGVAEFSLALHRATGEARHLDFARAMADDILARATEVDGGGLKWIQAEHRVQPDNLVAQTGYMQGAAGIGVLLLHLDAAERGLEYRGIRFPDAPWF